MNPSAPDNQDEDEGIDQTQISIPLPDSPSGQSGAHVAVDLHVEMSGKLRRLRKTHEGITFARPDRSAKRGDTIRLVEGAIIGGIYRIVKLAGRGGMGEVYLAENTHLNKPCALKVIPPDQVTSMSWQRFQTEAKAIARLDHIHLIKVTDLGIHEGCLPFYAMEYVDGENLADLLAEHKTLPLATALDIFIQLCDGLDYAHRNSIVHRDLKPANIMLSAAGNGKYSVKILDFGLAKLTQQDKNRQGLTSAGEIFGSPAYMSPEQCAGEKIDNRSDIYSLGCTLFETLTGRTPFVSNLAAAIIFSQQEAEPPSLESVVGPKRFPEALEVVMAKMLRKNPVERYQTMAEVKGDLEKVSHGQNVLPIYMNRTKDAAAELSGSRGRIQISAPGGKTNANISLSKFRPFANQEVQNVGENDYDSEEEEEEEQDDNEEDSRWSLLKKPPRIVWYCSTLLIMGLLGAYWFYSTHKMSQLTVKPVLISEPQDLKALSQDGENVFAALHDGKEAAASTTKEERELPPSAEEGNKFSSIIEQNRRRFRRFRFPLDVSIGTIHSAGDMYTVPARGEITFLENDPIYFNPDPILARYPQYLKRFSAGDIFAISLNTVDQCDRLVKACGSIPGVQKLTVYRSRTLSSAGLNGVQAYPALVNLDISYNDVDYGPLAGISRMKELEALRLSGGKNVGPVIRTIEHSDSIKELYLDDCKVSPEMIKSIATLTNLKLLSLNADQLTDQELTTLKKCKNLAVLSIIKTPLTKNTATILKSFAQLKTLYFYSEPRARSVSQPELQQLRKELAGVTVY